MSYNSTTTVLCESSNSSQFRVLAKFFAGRHMLVPTQIFNNIDCAIFLGNIKNKVSPADLCGRCGWVDEEYSATYAGGYVFLITDGNTFKLVTDSFDPLLRQEQPEQEFIELHDDDIVTVNFEFDSESVVVCNRQVDAPECKTFSTVPSRCHNFKEGKWLFYNIEKNGKRWFQYARV